MLDRPQKDAQVLAVGLVNRLLELDQRVHGLERECGRLRQLGSAAHQGLGENKAFDVPKTRHEWKLAEDAQAEPAGLWLYDVRVDDAVVQEGRRGEAFLNAFNLLGEAPEYLAAVQALNALPKPAAVPDVSIVIPVHGQLAYSLNAIDSLLRHSSRFGFEIIVIDDQSPDQSGLVLPTLTGIRYQLQPRNGGFIASCNAGANLARGRIVVMLNNDTRVVDGWLDALVESFERWPEAGLVGSKMHYPDGSLQEAGGIVWRDGSAWNYGRGDDPNRPQYAYARQVDYVSGCAIALPIAVWRELGGFDTYFHPAYCEDVDLAMRVRQAGYQVWFQPQSRIVHYEGKTSGTDTGRGTKAYQVVNTKKIFLRWREQLEEHRAQGEAIYFERERKVRRRMLVVDVTTPTPDQDAGSVQTVLALRTGIKLGYKMHFVPVDNWLFQRKYTTALQAMGVECAYAPFELSFDGYMQRYGWQFDVVLVFRAAVMEKCLTTVRAYAPQAAVLFHVADLHYLRMERGAALEGDEDMFQAAQIMKAREIGLAGQVDCTITHSSVEQEILSLETPGAPVALWPLMAEHHGTAVPFAARRDLCFLGGYRHPPNLDAVRYFVGEIFPLLRAAEPGIRFIIAGSFVPEEVLALAAEDVIVVGQVEDLQGFFDAARVFVCPLRVGAGVKGKVASAMAYGLPVVASAIGVEGTLLQHEHDVLVAEGAEAFAAEVLRLYRSETMWRRLSENGQAIVKRELSLDMGTRVLAAAIETAFAHKLGLAAHG